MTVAFWPQADLEVVADCPVCHSTARSVEQTAVKDYLHAVPGLWNYDRCGECGAVYLNPRPTPQSIGRAYSRYASHRAPKAFRREKRKPGAILKRFMENAYIRYRYMNATTTFDRVSGRALAAIFGGHRRRVDASMRHMPSTPANGCLLDIGCGNGDFMLRAARVGWRVFGVDIDPAAVAVCNSAGLRVAVGGVEAAGGDGPYNGITMSHVVEHLYDPVSTLIQCRKLLRPGGWLWLETPNIASVGYDTYRHCWRGLEAPRHLVLFDWQSLEYALVRAGFDTFERMPNRRICHVTFRESQQFATATGYADIPDPRNLQRMVKRAERIGERNPGRREFITLRARVASCD